MDEKFPRARLEGHNGLLIALSPEGKPVPADDGIKGTEYTCPFCGIKMYFTHAKTNESLFAKKPGFVHTDPYCIAIEKSEFGANNVVLKGSPEDFITALCAPVMPTGTKSPSTGNNPPTPGEPTGPKSVQLKNLEQIFKAGIPFMRPEENRFGFTVGDLVLSYVGFDNILETVNDELGSRIVYVVYIPLTPKTGFQKDFLLFKLFKNRKNEPNSEYIYFGLFCQSTKERSRFAKNFGDKTTKKGKEGLIACADWKKMPKTRCSEYCQTENKAYCDRCKGMYIGDLRKDDQVYPVPERMRKSKK